MMNWPRYAAEAAIKGSKAMKRVRLLCAIVVSLVTVWISFMLGGLFGLLVWFALFAFVAVEVVYHYGAKGSLSRSFKSNVSSDVPDASIGATTSSSRGYYDLDYRGRGKN
jgi:hypothetical protein